MFCKRIYPVASGESLVITFTDATDDGSLLGFRY